MKRIITIIAIGSVILLLACLFTSRSRRGLVSKPVIAPQCDSILYDIADINSHNIKCIKVGYLRERGFKKIPTEVFELQNLEVLDLSMNEIDSIPDAIEKLANLKVIAIEHSSIFYLSDKIGELQHLERLSFVDTKIRYLPNSVCKLQNLQKITIMGSDIEDLPSCLIYLPNIKRIFIKNFDEIPFIRKSFKDSLKNYLPNCQINID